MRKPRSDRSIRREFWLGLGVPYPKADALARRKKPIDFNEAVYVLRARIKEALSPLEGFIDALNNFLRGKK